MTAAAEGLPWSSRNSASRTRSSRRSTTASRMRRCEIVDQISRTPSCKIVRRDLIEREREHRTPAWSRRNIARTCTLSTDRRIERAGGTRMNATTMPAQHLWFLDTLVIVRVGHDQGGDGISVLERRAPCGDSPPLHLHHGEDEAFYVLEGELLI